MIDKDSKTYANLMEAFAGESKARNKYTYYAQAARAEGLETVAEQFEKFARNEEQHAKFWFQYLFDHADNTEDNLEEAMAGERFEWTDMYSRFAVEALDDGYPELAKMFQSVANIERAHENRFQEVLSNLRDGDSAVEANRPKGWVCEVCGHVAQGDNPPAACPVCGAIGHYTRE